MVKAMSGRVLMALALAAASVLWLLQATLEAQTKQPAPSAVAVKRIERGKYLVTIMSCNDCHTPYKMGPNGREPDMSRML